MAFEKKQYDVVLIEPPNKYLVERWDQPNYPAIGVAYIGNYLEKNTNITPAIIDGKLGRQTIQNTIDEAIALKKYKKAGVVCQSTQTIENVQDIINILMTKVFDLHFVNTICYPTKRNQEQIKDLAKRAGIMSIIGSFTSANSKRLTMLSKNINKNTYQVTNSDD